jgi:hypothetical protein
MPNVVRKLFSILSLLPSEQKRECLKAEVVERLEGRVLSLEIRIRKLETDLMYSQQKVLLLEQRVLDYRSREIT